MKIDSQKKEVLFWIKGFKFWFIGGIGIGVNAIAFFGLKEFIGVDLAWGVAICIAAFSNYIGNILIGNIKI